jgi:hypothetical protein
MPPLLAEHWLAEVWPLHPTYTHWPLSEWLHSRSVFQTFVTQEWQQFVEPFRETQSAYQLSFVEDEQLQDALPQLVRGGAIQPVTLADAAHLPTWAQSGLRVSATDVVRQRANILLTMLDEQTAVLSEARWEQWRAIAGVWAELTALSHHPQRYLEAAQHEAYTSWQVQLDNAFIGWLSQRYAPLASQRLPDPHHLFHVPHWLAYERRRQVSSDRVALLVLDGMSLATWHVIGRVWRHRHPVWQMAERLVLAQIPSLTAVSRQALVSGERPFNFAATLHHNRQEKQQWAKFWTRENVSEAACAYTHVSLGGGQMLPHELQNGRIQALCLINNTIDEIVHGASQGLIDVHASIHTWLGGEEGQRLESIIEELLNQAYTVYLTSDHGHTEAWGMGQPSEGVTVQTRSKRARIYSDNNAALVVHQDFPQTMLWQSQHMLPDNTWVLLAGAAENGRRLAFAPQDTRVVTHGGLTLDEMVVPVVRFSL